MRSILAIWASCTLEKHMPKMGFWLPHTDKQKPDVETILLEDEQAVLVGSLTMALLLPACAGLCR